MSTTPLSSPEHGKQRLQQFKSKFPRSGALTIQPVQQGGQGASGILLELYDSDDLTAALGVARFNQLMTGVGSWSGVKTVICCAHRLWPANHAEPTKRNAEVHCISAVDLEAFLAGGH
jgi:hypothetical protein